MLSVFFLSAVSLIAFMLSPIMHSNAECFCKDCFHAKSKFVECFYNVYHYAEFCYTFCCYAWCPYVKH